MNSSKIRQIEFWRTTGQVIRLTFRVKNQLTNLITGNLRAIANMERRLRNGIFDPEADRRDFEEYLRHGTRAAFYLHDDACSMFAEMVAG
jgi:hypothetical protein